MKKKTVVIVSVSLVLAILAIAVISTFPTYLFEVSEEPTSTESEIQSGNIAESTDDTIDIGDSNGIEAVLPDIDSDDTNESDTKPALSPSKGYNTLAEDSGAKLLAEIGAFEKGTDFKVNKLGIFNKTYYRIRHLVRDFSNKYTMYDISAKKDGKSIAPIADAKIVIDIPNNYDLEKTEIYFLISDNRVTKLDCSIDKTNKTAVVSFAQSGVYIIIEKSNDEDKNVSSENTQTDSSKPFESNNQTGSDNNSSNSSDNSSTITSSESSSSNDSDNDQNQNDTSSSTDSSNTSSSDEPVESNPEDWETMDGWVPWY